MENEIVKNDNVKNHICSFIDEWIKNSKEYNSASFARELGLSDSSVKRWRKKICAPDISLLPKICEIMGISLHTLFGVNTSNELTQDEKQLLKFYQLNPEFKSFIDNYIKNDEFRNAVNSIAKLSK